jgi:ABC-type uncharacterized transport system substrate-binding protein
MKRREFLFLLGTSALAGPTFAVGQPKTLPLVGFLVSASREGYEPLISAVLQGMNEAGYVDGKDVTMDYNFADGDYSRLPRLAANLVKRRPSVIFTTGSVVSALAAKAATLDIPIVFANGSDPIRQGLVDNINRPGHNLTRVSFFNAGLAPKRIELLRELLSAAKTIALLVNPKNSNATEGTNELTKAAETKGLSVVRVEASSVAEFGNAFEKMKRLPVDAAVIHIDALFQSEYRKLNAEAIRAGVPTMWSSVLAVRGDGLIGYSTNILEMDRQAGIYIGRILKGEKPELMPILFPTQYNLVINTKTAKSLGLTIPPSLIARADEVIE